MTALDDLAGLAAEYAADTEARRTLSPVVADALRDAGLFALCIPRPAGGGETAPGEFVDAIAAVARGDASAGWSVMVAATAGLMLGWVDPRVAREIAGDGRGVLAGVYAPGGTATPADGGYEVSGRWPFASGCRHATWLVGGALVPGQDGPSHRIVLIPAADAQILDTWHVAGLRGSGSDDFTVDRIFVPAERTLSLQDPPVADGPLYRFPVFGLLAAGIAAAAIGNARGAIDDFATLTAAKKPAGSARRLAERSSTQAAVARATALTGSAAAYVTQTMDEAWRDAREAARVTIHTRARLRLAAAHAVTASAEAVDAMYHLGGGTSLYESSPLQRRFRDAHAATQHMMVSPAVVELAGRALLGLEVDPALL